MCLPISTKHTNMTERQTDGQTDTANIHQKAPFHYKIFWRGCIIQKALPSGKVQPLPTFCSPSIHVPFTRHWQLASIPIRDDAPPPLLSFMCHHVYCRYYYNIRIVHIGTTTKKEKNLTREKNLTTIYVGLSNTSSNEAKSSFQSINLAETALSHESK